MNGIPIQDQPNKNTNGFDKRPNEAGRPLKIYTILKKKGYSKDDINACFGELLFYTEDELKELKNRKDIPAITLLVAKHLVKALESDTYEKGVQDILNRFSGMPIQQIKQENVGSVPAIIVKSEVEANEIEKLKGETE